MEHEGDRGTNWSPQRLGKETEGTGDQRKNRDHPDNRIVENGQNSEKSPGDRRRFDVSQTRQLTQK